MKNSCSACDGSWPNQDYFIADLGESKAYFHPDQFFSGWVVLVLKSHATELFQLTSSVRHTLMDEVSKMGAVLFDVYAAKKINYVLLGNVEPHIHWHIIPRLPNDPSPKESVFTIAHAERPLCAAQLQLEKLRIIRKLTEVG